MKIKHWQGYGTVNAIKVKDNAHTLHVRVEGNHEWGLIRNDEYDIFNWLVKKFDRYFKDKTYSDFYKCYPRMSLVAGEKMIDGMSVETCDYILDYETC